MKKIKSAIIVACAACALSFLTASVVTGCKTSQQQIVFNSLYSVEHGTVTAYDGYIDLVVSGTVPTNDVPRVSKAFNTFQGSFLIALDAAQFNTNALAPDSLVVESQDIINMIITIKKDIK